MTPSQLIAHRGLWWPNLEQQNGLAACRDAFEAGYSVEVDVRRGPSGNLALSHDPLQPGNARPLASFRHLLELAEKFPSSQLFIDVKEPGTETEIVCALIAHGLLPRSWLFDFELAGVDLSKTNLEASAGGRSRFLARVSDRGEGKETPRWAAGVWLDQWDADWATAEIVTDFQVRKNYPVFIVSSELQGRRLDLAKVAEWEKADGLCTDFPHLLAGLDSPSVPLHPANPWWEVRP